MKHKHIILGRVLVISCVFIILFLASGCKDDARHIWKSVIKKCANNDLLGPNIFYFGPSNNLGPGTIFQKFTKGGIQVSHLISEYVSDPESFVNEGQIFSCEGMSSSSHSINADLSLASLLSISGKLGLELKKAKKINVKTDSVQWIDIITGPFKKKILDLSDDHAVKNDLLESGHLVLSRALRVRGMYAELDFSSEIGGKIQADFPEISISEGPANVGIGGQWVGKTKLILKASSDFYIAGELRNFLATGLAASSEELGPIEQNVDELKFLRR